MRHLRIAYTHAFCWPEVRRGGERYLHELAGAMARRGHDVCVFGGATVSSTSEEDGVHVTRIGRGDASDPGASIRFARKLLPRLLAPRFDVVHSLGPRDAVASLRAASVHRRRRTVYTNLGIPIREWWETQPDNDDHERVVRDVDVYGCLSRFGLGCLRTHYGRDGALTPGGVNLETFAPVAARDPNPTILYSGAIGDPDKDIDVLLRALAIVSEREPRVRLWLSGPGDPAPLLDAAPARARERTHVLPLGGVHEQPARYAAAWATALPAWYQAFGLALVESLACGTPVVACDHASLPELVRPDIGALAAPKDPRAFAEAFTAALDLATQPGIVQRCRDAARPHDWDGAVAPAVEQLYA